MKYILRAAGDDQKQNDVFSAHFLKEGHVSAAQYTNRKKHSIRKKQIKYKWGIKLAAKNTEK
ncbi:hypothetical protein AA12717_3771 [Gluconacetobacter sacchari DSM 12717]|uniref:Uncharacterized protein n=1 Tax=Gluconacetobacter sacchari DSM 12717 TaxID=1307940 RepID=A0ABQ0PFE1_9PROT|nr:hypothetical protein AA12717_3771 [Gluconacetobacter sacchari DSM 12717]